MFVGAGDLRLATSSDLITWTMHSEIVLRREDCPDFASQAIDSGPAPFITKDGVVAILNATDSSHHGRVFVSLFDSQNPTKHLEICETPILEPQSDWERFGYLPNMVTATSMTFTGQEFRLYYSGADRCVGVATSPAPGMSQVSKAVAASDVLASSKKTKSKSKKKSKPKKKKDKICGV